MVKQHEVKDSPSISTVVAEVVPTNIEANLDDASVRTPDAFVHECERNEDKYDKKRGADTPTTVESIQDEAFVDYDGEGNLIIAIDNEEQEMEQEIELRPKGTVHSPETSNHQNEKGIMMPEEVMRAIDKAVRAEIRLVRRQRQLEQNGQEPVLNEVESGEKESLVVHCTKSNAIHELCVALQHYPQEGIPLSQVDELLPKIQDFHIARFWRKKFYRSQPWGILGLFMHVADMRLDLEWVEDRAWRRANDQQSKTTMSWWDFCHLHAHNDVRRTYFVYAMHVIYFVMMLVAFHLNEWELEPMSVNPLIGPSAEVLLQLGGLKSEAVIQDQEGYRLVTALVLHAGIIHLVINMLALQFIGGPVERVHGTAVTTAIFVISGVGGNIASVLFGIPGSVSVGASGGLFGLLGLCLASIVTNWDLITIKNHRDKSDSGFPYRLVFVLLAIELIINVIIGLTPYVDNFAHLGGFIYGGLLSVPLLAIHRIRLFGCLHMGHFTAKRKNICFALLLRIFLFLSGLGLLCWSAWTLTNHDGGENGDQSFCYSCRYLTCVPFPFWGDERWWHCDSCHTTTGTFVRVNETTVLTLTCPDIGKDPIDPVKIDLQDPDITLNEISDNLPDYCRTYCPT